jgi:hypothetical protein
VDVHRSGIVAGFDTLVSLKDLPHLKSVFLTRETVESPLEAVV